MKDPIWILMAAVVALAVILFGVWVDPTTGPKVDSAHTGPWVVVRESEGITEYLAWVNVGKGLAPDWRQEWTVLEDDAWLYGERSSAEADAKVSRGVARPLRSAS